MATRATRWIALLAPLAWGSACAPSTEVVVRLEAEPEAIEGARGLRVRLCDTEGELELDSSVALGAGDGDARFPLGIQIVPRGGDPARRFWLVAELLARESYPVGRQRAEGGFIDGERLVHTLRFDGACWGVLGCAEGETCLRGACVDGRLPPLASSAPREALPSPCRSPASTCPAVAGDGGARHGCAVSSTGSLWCWGDNGLGQVGVEDRAVAPTPAIVALEGPIRAIGAGQGSTCAATVDGALWCWGENGLGELGLGDHGEGTDRALPARLDGDANWSDVAVGGHGCGIRGRGELWCWGGENLRGELGVSTEGVVDVPTRVGAGWARVSVGPTSEGRHSCGVRLDGSLWCWGANGRGQLGVGDREDHAPIRVPLDGPADLVAVGDGHTCAASEGGALWCWGRNDSGQLGLGSAGEDRLEPARLPVEADWTGLAAGSAHTCAIDSDGRLLCWGAGSSGQLGGGDLQDRSEPSLVPVERAVRAVWAGSEHGCAVDDEGSLLCWGESGEGRLGLGEGPDVLSPAPVCAPR